MSDEFRRMWEQQESLRRLMDPLGDMRQLLSCRDDPLKSLGIASATIDFLYQEEERRKLLSDLVDVGGVAKMLRELDQEAKLLSGPLEDEKRLGLLEEHLDLRQSVKVALEAKQSYESLFRLPRASELSRMAHDALTATSIPPAVFGSEESLAAAMARMHSPWLQIEEPFASTKAFSEIVAMGRGIEDLRPFDPVLGDVLRSSLGDWRDWLGVEPELLVDPVLRTGLYVERGLDSNLTDFTPSAFDEGLRIAGLRGLDPSESLDEEEDGLARARVAFEHLQRFEIALRRFIEGAMKAAFGEHWMKRQLPAKMLDAWTEKRDKAIKAGQDEQPLIEYADFSDYKGIIERKDNWNAVFSNIFGRPEDIRESLQRLFPVRIATMHARLITRDDELLLLVETKRVLKAIGSE
ncbi:Swt1 family HEPN domain-containing protein [Paracidovorax valerianellae]|uniref:Swt1-like HEPN domain-containing protein n=1 Tax=Paracidovorax valerianellae TaxID=187868 RepID=A0A1G6L2H5_9BURK|nr:Swt1 family HEPN domain-containing protein [Paracidovorax valerianellae]MDA8446511.1 Swt1 family HEPN domain-containing protein [Paracidovorax valerianellae]SDC37512.1 hypothetical protein SAMN05192589_10251 [Paracidovorax valerianellae]